MQGYKVYGKCHNERKQGDKYSCYTRSRDSVAWFPDSKCGQGRDAAKKMSGRGRGELGKLSDR